MYRAIELTMEDRDLYRFVWRSFEKENPRDYRMTRVTFGVSAANLCVKRNASDHAQEYPLAAKAVKESFYVHDALTRQTLKIKVTSCKESRKSSSLVVGFSYASGTQMTL